jgi:two-component sensor histidine kinase
MVKGVLICFVAALFCCCAARAQSDLSGELPHLVSAYRAAGQDTDRVSAALALAYYYKAKPGEAKQDMDSAFFWTDQAEALAKKAIFASGVERAVFMRNFIRIEAHQQPAVEVALSSLSDTNRIKVLLELSIWEIFNHRPATDLVGVRLRDCLRQSDSLHNPRMQQLSGAVLGLYYYVIGDTIAGRRYFFGALEYLDASGAYSDLARLCNLLELRMDQPSPEILYYLGRAARSYLRAGDPFAAYRLYKYIETFGFFVEGDVALAMASARSGLGLAQQRSDTAAINGSYAGIAKYAFYEGDYREALAYSLERLKSLREADDTLSSRSMYTFLGDIYRQLGMKAASIKAYTTSLRLHKKMGETSQEPVIAVKLTWAMIAEGRAAEGMKIMREIGTRLSPDYDDGQVFLQLGYANCYDALGQYEKAEQCYKQAWAHDAKGHFVYQTTVCYYSSVFYAHRHRPAAAIRYAKMAVEAVHKPMPAWMKKDLYYILFREDSVLGDYRSAVGYYRKYADLNDTLLVMTSRQVERLEHQVETDKKDQELLAKDNQIRRAAITRNFIVTGIGLLAIILLLVYNQYRLKRKANAVIGRSNLQLQQHLVEKENMMTEIHHRVKNNLQTIVSLLESQSAYLRDDALSAIKDSQNRVHAMSLIHQKLYLSEGNLTKLEMSSYMRELVAYLKDAFDSKNRIRFSLDLSAVWLDVSQAVPIGLITNEVVTNSMKHAFSGQPDAAIHVRMGSRSPGMFFLVISDNGRGLPPDLDLERVGSLGLRLIRGLAESLNGSLRVSGEHGASISVEIMVG